MAGIAFGEDGPPDIVFLHATGFNARAYRTLLAPLAREYRVLALDLRGHGRSALPARLFGYASWARHRDDVIAVFERHLGRPALIAGHSMGATVGLLVGGVRPDLARGLCLVDPVILQRRFYAFMRAPGAPLLMRYAFPIARKAGSRRAAFSSLEEAQAALTGRGIFKSFTAEALADYVADGFVSAEGGGVRLACRPAFEAATFAAQRNESWRALVRAPGPLIILRAERGSTCPAPVAAQIAQLRPDARIATVEGSSHGLPFEKPDRVRSAIESMMVITGRQGYRDLV